MRTVLYICLMQIAEAINPEHMRQTLQENVPILIGIFVFALILDILESVRYKK